MPDTLPPEISEAKLNELGIRLLGVFHTYETDRRMVEEKWLRNLRQYRGIYDPEVLKMIPADRSKAYPRMTAWMVKGTVARLMQIAFPQTEKNYGVKPSPLPDLSVGQLQQVLDQLVEAKAQGGDPVQVELTDEEIEKGILAFAKGRAERMELKVDDDLMQMEYITLARKIVRSSVLYGMGVAKGPLHKKIKARAWQRNPFTNRYTAVETEKLRPLLEFLPVWNYYFDMTATALDKQDGVFERHIMIRSQIEELADRPDFLADRIHDYLRDHHSGNYRARWWESVIKGEPKAAQASVANKEGRKWEAVSYWGLVSGHELRGAGVTIKEEDLGKSFQANVWMLDNIVIKARLAPLGDTIRHHHEFIFEDDELSIAGNGLPETLRDSQLSVCETARAALDNMSVIGPMAVVNEDVLVPGQDLGVRKHKTWRVEGLPGTASLQSAVANVSIDSHLTELRSLLEVFLAFADKESGLPPPAMGDVSGGGSEALRTQRNASMFLGAAALPVRDTMRNFDIFTMSVVSALVAWNQKYDPNPTRDGDHDVIARGSTSLIAKEVLSQQLEQFRLGLTDPEEAAHIKKRGLLIARMKASDLPEELLEDEDKANEKIQAQQQTMQAQMAAQQELIEAQVRETLAKAFANIAKGESDAAGIQANIVNSIIEALKVGDKTMAEHVKASTAMEVASARKQATEA